MTKRVGRLAPALILALCQLSLFVQGPARQHQNVDTDPDNSIRLYHALNGLGKTTALYMYPLKDHGPASAWLE